MTKKSKDDNTSNSKDLKNDDLKDAVDDVLKETKEEVEKEIKEEIKIVEQNLDYKDSLARLQAEFANFKERSNREQDRMRGFGKRDAILKLVPVLEEVARAKKHEDIAEDSPFGKIISKIESSFKDLGITQFGEKGDEFDPMIHMAIQNRDANESDKITDGQTLIDDVVEQGYKLDGDVISTAKVITVSK